MRDAEVENECSYTSAPPYAFLVWAGTALPSYSMKFFLGQAAASGYEGLTTFWELTPSSSSGRARATKPLARPEDGDGVSSRNVVKSSYPDTAVTEFCRRESCKTYIYLLVFKIAKIR